MKKNKIALISAAVLMAVAPLAGIAMQSNVVRAVNNSVRKTVMHTSIAYDKDGNSTGQKYYAYGSITVDPNPITINGSQYYKISDKDQYIKVTNIDGVTRKITHNAYIYRTSTQRTPYGMTASSKKWKFYKGETVTTYGGSYKFKNGKHYFRVGGPRKQYIKSYNLGSVIGTNTSSSSSATSKPETSNTSSSTSSEEATATVAVARYYKKTAPIVTFNSDGKATIVKSVPDGTKLTVDRLERGERADKVANLVSSFNGDQAIYHIKGTDNWIYSIYVKTDKKLTEHDYDADNFSYITFPKDTDVYNADGTIQDHNGQKISKQKGQLKVDKLVYLWVPSENKAELFYHLVGTSFYASTTATEKGSTINVGHNAYVKADDVKFVRGIQLTPSNTAAEAQAAA